MNFRTGAWEGIEALARIDHPEFGLLPPSAMMHVADDPRTAPDVALRTVDLALACWSDLAQRAGYAGTVSVNLSAACLGDGDFPAELLAHCARRGCGPDRLMMEVTETAVPEDAIEAMDILISLRLKGFTLSIDDFGTGHSSLEQLQFLPFSEVKIDKTFVAAAEYSPRSRAIVENVVSLAHHIGADVVAEGVESARTWTWLRQAGCDRAQGFFVARPMAADELPGWHERWLERFPKL